MLFLIFSVRILSYLLMALPCICVYALFITEGFAVFAARACHGLLPSARPSLCFPCLRHIEQLTRCDLPLLCVSDARAASGTVLACTDKRRWSWIDGLENTNSVLSSWSCVCGLLLNCTELSFTSLLIDLRHTKNDKMGKLNISVLLLFCMIFKSFFPG